MDLGFSACCSAMKDSHGSGGQGSCHSRQEEVMYGAMYATAHRLGSKTKKKTS